MLPPAAARHTRAIGADRPYGSAFRLRLRLDALRRRSLDIAQQLAQFALAFGVAYPQSTLSLLLWWPVGGAKYRIRAHQRFSDHLEFVAERGLDGVVSHVQKEGKAFNADARGGPWASVLRHDKAFAASYAKLRAQTYKAIVEEMRDGLFDRDTSPGAEPEDLLKLDIPALVVPGRDESHATSAARYLEECLRKSRYWDVLPEGQTGEEAAPRLLGFLSEIGL